MSLIASILRFRQWISGGGVHIWRTLPLKLIYRVARSLGYGRPWKRLQFLLELPKVYSAARPPSSIPASLRLAWIIPDFGHGSGGHASIFRLSAELSRLGHINEFWILPGSRFPDTGAAHQAIQRWFTPQKCNVRFLEPNVVDDVQCDVCIATEYRTAYYAEALRSPWKKIYLIQDYEPYFFPAGTDFLVAEESYRLSLEPLTAGKWLAKRLSEYYKHTIQSFEFGVEQSCYHADDAIERQRFSIGFYLRETTARRCADLGAIALQEVCRELPGVFVHFFGQPKRFANFGIPCVHHGILTPEALAILYRKLDVGVVLSATNHSIVPAEMMACGLPVVELDTPSARLDYPASAITLAPAHPKSIAAAIVELLSNRALWETKSRGGIEHARGLSWEKSAGRLAQCLR